MQKNNELLYEGVYDMQEIMDAEKKLYDDRAARPEFYSESWNFDPLQYLRSSKDEEGRVELSLDIKYRRHWFRLVFPQGKIMVHEKTITKEAAMFTVRVYADKSDDPAHFLSEGTAIRYFGNEKAFERYYVDWAETMATGRALTSAGFDVPWCNKPTEDGTMNPYTGETIMYEEDGAAPTPKAPIGPPQYSDVTAPPPDGDAQMLGQQKLPGAVASQPQKTAPQTPVPAQTAGPLLQTSTPAQTAGPLQQPPALSQAAGPLPQTSAPSLPSAPEAKPTSLEEAMAKKGTGIALPGQVAHLPISQQIPIWQNSMNMDKGINTAQVQRDRKKQSVSPTVYTPIKFAVIF